MAADRDSAEGWNLDIGQSSRPMGRNGPLGLRTVAFGLVFRRAPFGCLRPKFRTYPLDAPAGPPRFACSRNAEP